MTWSSEGVKNESEKEREVEIKVLARRMILDYSSCRIRKLNEGKWSRGVQNPH